MFIHRNVLKRNTLATLLGQPELNIEDLEYDYLSLLGAADDDHINQKWLTVFQAFGATAKHYNDAAQQFLIGQGAPYEHVSSNWVWFWEQGGIVITPDGVMLASDDSFMIFSDNAFAEYA